MGDFNINLLQVENHVSSAEFLESMYSDAFIPLINKPTRITDKTAALIDNIYCNSVENILLNGICYTDISDHLPIFCITSEKCVTDNMIIKKRLINTDNMNKFIEKFQNYNWNNILLSNDCQCAFTNFYDHFCHLILAFL